MAITVICYYYRGGEIAQLSRERASEHLSAELELNGELVEVVLGGEHVDSRPDVLGERRPADGGKPGEHVSPRWKLGHRRLQQTTARRQILHQPSAYFKV